MIRIWSVSAHRAYRSCPRSWWLQYVLQVPQGSSSDSNRGQVLHAGMAAGYRELHRIRSGRWLPDRAWQHVEAAVFRAVIDAAGITMTTEEIEDAADTACEALILLGPQPGDEPIGVEHRLDIEVDGVPIQYRADVLYRRADRFVVRDWKSRKALPRRRDLPRDRQLALGALCAARVFGVTEVDVEIASIGSGVAVSAPIDRAAARDAGRAVAETARLAAADRVFEPTPGEVCAGCKVQAHCPVWVRDTSAVPAPSAVVS